MLATRASEPLMTIATEAITLHALAGRFVLGATLGAIFQASFTRDNSRQSHFRLFDEFPDLAWYILY